MSQRTSVIGERRKSKGSDLYQRIAGTHYQSVEIGEHTPGGSGGSGVRHSRVSPSPGRSTTIAYVQCPLSDPDVINLAGNVLAIPLAAIQTNVSQATAPSAAGTTSMLSKASGLCRAKISYNTYFIEWY